MNHNYAVTDFKIIKEPDTDIYEQIVSVDLSNVMELPMVLVHRLENTINHMIAAYEEENGINIPLENMELGMYMDVNIKSKELSINTYVVYSIDKECITSKEIVTATDSDYSIIKKYFFSELNTYIFEQIRRIQGCVA